MARRTSEHPTSAELAILGVLWKSGPLPLRAIVAALPEARESSVFITLRIMVKKGYVSVTRRRKDEGGTIYLAKANEVSTIKRLMRSAAGRVFGGSVVNLVQNLIRNDELDANEIAELKKLLNPRQKNEKP